MSCDGWSSSCIVEANYTWTGGSITSKDVWTKSPQNSSSNSNDTFTKSQQSSNSSFVDKLFWYFLSLVVLSMGLNTISQMLNNFSNGSIFSLINEVQLILLLPILPNYMSDEVKSFIASLNYCLFSFDFININFEKNFQNQNISLDYNQPGSYLNQINLNSGSGFVNIQSNIIGICIFIVIHISLLIWNYVISIRRGNRWYSKWILKLFERMTFGWYFTYINCSYLMFLLISLSEIYRFDSSNTKRIVSLSFSFVIIIFCLVFLLFTFTKWVKAQNSEELQKMKFTKQLFEATKDSNFSRFNPNKYLIQRLLLWMIAVLWNCGSVYIKLGVYAFVQLCCSFYIIIVRPFDKFKENAFEIINELFYLVLIILLFWLESETAWTRFFQVIYISIIFMNNIMIFIISLIWFIKDLIVKIKKGILFSL